ncbi:hypothetical protein MHU86_2340 [Fragilaria crotonensis]|nr:hypothetical protein MHU86_2340 [Fragilaria crotonensis]
MADEADVTFAFSPALAIQGLLDYTRADHAKIYKSAIREVSKEPFDCEADGLYQFLKDVQDRADEMGWSDSILKITLEVLDNGDAVQENLIENYGTITLEQVTESELQYINEQGREAQDTYMLYKCLMASLSSNAKKKVSIWSEQYRIGDNDVCSGVALLKIIIRESHLDTNATTNQIRTKLLSLDKYITTIDSDIGRFNQYVKLLVQSLTARNQTTSDLLINLFKGYGAVSDEVFRNWLSRKQDDHEEGEEITPDELMIAAKNKYDIMVEKGTWNAPTADEKIVALEAKLESTVKNINKKVSIELRKKATKKGGTNDKSKKKANKSKGQHPKSWPPPKGDEKKEASFNDQTWYWCGKDTGGKCEKWRVHKPKECLGAAAPTAKRSAESDGKKNKDRLSKKLKVAKAYVARMEKRVAETDSPSDDDST